jgi:hypothetical protein
MKNKDLYEFEKEILRKIDNNEPLTEDEVEELTDGAYSVDSEVVDTGRWVKYIIEIIQLGGRTFSVEWQQGLTENQECLFESQIPVEVKKVTVKKMIETTEWVRLEK